MRYGDERLPPRFWNKVAAVKGGGCWYWMAGLFRGGYGQFRFGRNTRAHRVAYEALVGEIPAGLDLDHLCRVRHCVNPEHLEPVTRKENIRRGETGKYRRSAS
jgi:hypothetical protein